ncbi:hypothetical protein CXB40_26580 [Pseudomonas syringae pv. avii]|uniref:Uncharacterized protein n=1 Tax=Pseudomonas syringae pv. avii TaxID=663959 RepID=A0A3M5U1F7_PSESX|nr:hypothetical protein CXB40_26580 [Pseudomonas syringae pv. avii]RMU39690.1 hypothetical protein ALP29_200351 [Pseudomonas syringae pv. avii]
MTIMRGDHVSVELVERRNELVDHPFFSMAFVAEDRDQTGSAIELPEWAFWGAEPDAGKVIDNDVTDKPTEQRNA